MVELYEAKSHTVGELAQRFGISHATVYRTVQRRAEQSPQAESPELPS
ncbi:helix-turn-helix domain-containing protein [Micropruina glycogenica]|uniref:DNA resolvase n=1 Tax=Micropruina glycogenica TaxID=75385 RepID=A0A2N9JCX4_9ACTN